MNSSSKTSIPVFFAADNSLALYVPVKFYVREIINLIEINYNLSPGYIFSSDKRILSSDFIVDESIEALLFHQSPDLTLENHNSGN